MCDSSDTFDSSTDEYDDYDALISRDPELVSPFTVVGAVLVDVDQVDPDDDPADLVALDRNLTGFYNW